MADKELSFLPEDYVERRMEHRTNLICITLFIVVLGAVVGGWFVTTRQRSDIRAQQEQVNKSYADAARRLEQLQELEQRKDQMLRKAQVTATLIEPVPRTFLLADLINRMPPTLSLFDLQVSSKVVRATRPVVVKKSAMTNAKGKDAKDEKLQEEPPPRFEVTMTMTGVAPTDVQVAQYMSSLSRSPLLGEVNLVFSEENKVEEQTMRRFKIEMTLNDTADVRVMDPDAIPRKLKSDPLSNSSVASPALPGVDGAADEAGLELLKSKEN
jgi:Tfp pilus assembly protein PilN